MSRLMKFILVGFLVFAIFKSYQLMDGNRSFVQAVKEEKFEKKIEDKKVKMFCSHQDKKRKLNQKGI